MKTDRQLTSYEYQSRVILALINTVVELVYSLSSTLTGVRSLEIVLQIMTTDTKTDEDIIMGVLHT